MMEVVAVFLGLWWYETDVGGCGGDLVEIMVFAVVTALMVIMVVGLWLCVRSSLSKFNF